MSKIYDVYGIGNPLIDLLSIVDDELLETLGLHKGTMHLIDYERREIILSHLSDMKQAPGGSCANTIQALSSMGLKTVYSGSIAEDGFGNRFEQDMKNKGVITDLKRNSQSTGSSIILVTKDAERTQNTYLGACQAYNINDIDIDKIQQSKILFFTGYMWDTDNQKEAVNKAIEIAKEANTKIVFDVADPFAVARSKEDFLEIIKSSTNMVMMNYEEGKMLTDNDNLMSMVQFLRPLVNSGVIKNGSKGSLIFTQDEIIHIPVYQVDAIDTTGAGDIYSAGILYGLIKELDLLTTGKIASSIASKLVGIVGARLENINTAEFNEL